MIITQISKETLQFLKQLQENNNRDWFTDHKAEFKEHEKAVKLFFAEVFNDLKTYDEVDDFKMFRIYRDVRFSKDKTPYKTHLASSFHRVKPKLRGGYYVHIEPGNTFLATGFWNPNKEDLLRIRKELELDADEMREILANKNLLKIWGTLEGEELKTSPAGFDKEHEAIDLIRKKQYVFTRNFSDKEVLSADFAQKIQESFKAIRPFFDYMSDVLTTDLNGVSLL
ncbi:DUF2461 domain-containing protein [Zhouia sp. PK063]|uniref:DUF2461 domain-containing protein n=1 Tax=Zhouia sp. PK063 TaxID=3373602 RepID=UPI0037A3A20C